MLVVLSVLSLVCVGAVVYTFVLGRKLGAGRDRRAVGDVSSAPEDSTDTTSTVSMPDLQPVEALPAVLPVVRVTVNAPGEAPREASFQREVIKIGTDPKSHLRLRGDKIVRIHAVIEVERPSTLRIIDLGSPNGTRVNGASVHHRALADGDTIEIGDVRLTVSLNDAVEALVPAA